MTCSIDSYLRFCAAAAERLRLPPTAADTALIESGHQERLSREARACFPTDSDRWASQREQDRIDLIAEKLDRESESSRYHWSATDAEILAEYQRMGGAGARRNYWRDEYVYRAMVCAAALGFRGAEEALIEIGLHWAPGPWPSVGMGRHLVTGVGVRHPREVARDEVAIWLASTPEANEDRMLAAAARERRAAERAEQTARAEALRAVSAALPDGWIAERRGDAIVSRPKWRRI